MNWTTEIPKDSGIYWAKYTLNFYGGGVVNRTEPVQFIVGQEHVYILGWESDCWEVDSIMFWGDKLEIPE